MTEAARSRLRSEVGAGGRTMLYDPETPDAWIISDTTVPLVDAADRADAPNDRA